MKTDIGKSRNEQVQLDGIDMRTQICDEAWSDRLLVYTEDVDLFRKLSQWRSCLGFDPFQRTISFGDCDYKQYVMAFTLQFPATERRRLEGVCRDYGDHKPRRINLHSWDADLDFEGGYGSLIHAIILEFALVSDSKTVNDMVRKYGEDVSEKRIREVFGKLSQPGMPLVRHHGFKYNLRLDIEKTGGRNGNGCQSIWQ